MSDSSNRIGEVRERKRLKQTDLAPRIGMSRSQLGNIESGNRKVDLAELRVIARELQCSVADLLLPEDVPTLPDSAEADLLAALRATPGYDSHSYLTATRAVVEAGRAMALFHAMPANVARTPETARQISDRLAVMDEDEQRRALQLLDAAIPFRR